LSQGASPNFNVGRAPWPAAGLLPGILFSIPATWAVALANTPPNARYTVRGVMSLAALVHWLNELPFSIALRESELAFPITEAVHLLGLAISVGTIMWVDLRLMGLAMRRERLSDVVERLEPWAVFGFVIMFISGILLFLGKPDNYYPTAPFRIKVLLLPLAALNVLFFHKKVLPNAGRWDSATAIPWQARFVGAFSAVLWTVIIVLGRWTAYYADELFSKSR